MGRSAKRSSSPGSRPARSAPCTAGGVPWACVSGEQPIRSVLPPLRSPEHQPARAWRTPRSLHFPLGEQPAAKRHSRSCRSCRAGATTGKDTQELNTERVPSSATAAKTGKTKRLTHRRGHFHLYLPRWPLPQLRLQPRRERPGKGLYVIQRGRAVEVCGVWRRRKGERGRAGWSNGSETESEKAGRGVRWGLESWQREELHACTGQAYRPAHYPPCTHLPTRKPARRPATTRKPMLPRSSPSTRPPTRGLVQPDVEPLGPGNGPQRVQLQLSKGPLCARQQRPRGSQRLFAPAEGKGTRWGGELMRS